MVNIDTIALQAATDIMALPQPVDLLGGHVQLKAKIQIIVRNVVEDALDKAFPDSAAVSDCRRYCQREADESAAPIAAQSDVAAASVARTQLRHDAINALLEVATAAYEAMDNSEERANASGGEDAEYLVQGSDFEALSAAMDKIDALPDDEPGITSSGGRRAAWALRDLFVAPLHEAGNAAAVLNLSADETTAVLAWLEIHRTGPAAAPAIAAPTEVERDAKRYRFLREDPPLELAVRRYPSETERGCYLDGPTLDSAIDAAIATGEKHE